MITPDIQETKLNDMVYTKPDNSWLVLVNPNAGSGKGGEDWPAIEKLLTSEGFRFTTVFTEKKYHAIDLATNKIEEGYTKIVVVGGDGTLNEVVNGIFTQKQYPPKEILVGTIPVGIGNDWRRMYHIPSDYHEAISVLKECRTFIQDTGLVHYHESGIKRTRYFANIAGLGFDARVVQKTNQQKDEGKGGALLYFLNIFTNLMKYRCTQVSIETDGERVFHDSVFSVSLGIGKYSGGGMRQTPEAEPDDGRIDMTVIRKMSKARIILSLKRLYDGTILQHPRVTGFTGRKIRIDSEPAISVEADGELLGHTPVEIEILPKSLKIIVGKE